MCIWCFFFIFTLVCYSAFVFLPDSYVLSMVLLSFNSYMHVKITHSFFF